MSEFDDVLERFRALEERLDGIEEKLEELLDLARLDGVPNGSYDPPEDPMMELGFSDQTDWEAGFGAR